MSSTLSFGGVSLEKYLSGPVEQAEAEQRRLSLREKIKQIKRSGKLAVEAMPLQMLETRVRQAPVDALYPQLDPSFLSMSHQTHFRGYPVDVPKFSVYHIYPGENHFQIKMGRWGDFFRLWTDLGRGYQDKNKPSVLVGPLRASTIIDKEALKTGNGTYDFEPQSDFTKWLKEKWLKEKGYPEVEFTSMMNGIVPPKTKEKIKQAKRIFGKRGLFFIAETKPEAWNVREFTKDPLVAGVLEDKCYLIDKFDTTPLEEYVTREFTR